MTQAVLSVDISQSPALASLWREEDQSLVLLDQRQFEFFPLAENNENLAELKALLEQWKGAWHNALLIIPPHDYLSLNLNMPFDNPRTLSRVIDLEVQDMVPFDVSEFVVQHRSVASDSEGSLHNIHISAMPKKFVASVLEQCYAQGIEPMLLCPPASILAAAYDLARDNLKPNCCLLYARHDFCNLLFLADGKVISDCAISLGLLTGRNGTRTRSLIEQIGLNIASYLEQQKYPVDEIYLLGDEIDQQLLSKSLELPVKQLDLSSHFKTHSDAVPPGALGRSYLAGLGILFFREQGALQALTNFRTKEFALRFPWAALRKGLLKALPFLAVVVLSLVAALIGTYLVREAKIKRIETEVQKQIRSVVTDLQVAPGLEYDGLIGQINGIDAQLKSLGSPSRFNPLHTLAEITKNMPTSGGIDLRHIDINGDNVKIDGEAPDYAARERIEKALSKRKRTFCDVKKAENESGYYASAGITMNLTRWGTQLNSVFYNTWHSCVLLGAPIFVPDVVFLIVIAET